MSDKPLPQFNSHAEAVAYFEKYGRLEFFGRGGHMAEYYIYTYHVKDGRTLHLFIYQDGRVIDYRKMLKELPPLPPKPTPAQQPVKKDNSKLIEVAKDGKCECKAAGRFRWIEIDRISVYMCIKCNKPVYDIK